MCLARSEFCSPLMTYNSALGSSAKGTADSDSTRSFARAFIETAPFSPEDKSKFAHLNAERLLLARTSSSTANN